ncbi:class I SAM-dependent methyltransferase [Caldalkalibacillus salinus]|uniref:class I SAM-dependent methyltransferase n=1 Tax=Caldalkalibacillus salinus TaxID=2803787 RepID=UPI001922222F|nr:class I SAM-dependent methyltransferase [Caldalkalibacillus salinus]
MPNHEDVYQNQVEQYDRLVSKQPSLLDVIEEIRPLNGLDVIELGAGSGRFTTVMAPYVNAILALDASADILALNEKKLKQEGHSHFKTQVADHRHIPAPDASADLVIAGWTICYLGSANVEGYHQNIEQVYREMMRVLRPKGSIIIFETMGTGVKQPHPPDFLKEYYTLLENQYGFKHQWMRTDYQFADIEEAETLTRFFFGDDLAHSVVKDHLVTLPECAGVWWLHKA